MLMMYEGVTMLQGKMEEEISRLYKSDPKVFGIDEQIQLEEESLVSKFCTQPNKSVIERFFNNPVLREAFEVVQPLMFTDIEASHGEKFNEGAS